MVERLVRTAASAKRTLESFSLECNPERNDKRFVDRELMESPASALFADRFHRHTFDGCIPCTAYREP